MEVGYSEVIQFDGLSAFRPCGRDPVEFLNITGWALYGQMESIRKHWPTSHYLLSAVTSHLSAKRMSLTLLCLLVTQFLDQ